MRLVIISNRLPFTLNKVGRKLEFQDSVGGLVTGISGYLKNVGRNGMLSEYIWIGWPGLCPAASERVAVRNDALEQYNAVPVFLSKAVMDQFYLGFCNRTLWPLFHYFPSYAAFDDELWQPYRTVNEAFCEAAASVVKSDDIIWIHDYHFMLLPRLLRERMPELSIGFFLHIPFPSFEMFRLLPGQWRRELIAGLLGADLVGFHTYDYTQYFLRCVSRILGHDHDMGRISLEDRVVKAETFPMGIEFSKFRDAFANDAVREGKEKLERQLSERKVILSVDRLDYSKGIAQRLRGYAVFLERNPAWRGKVVLLCEVVPSRIGVERYQHMKKQIDELVGEINGRFGNVDWTPIIYQYRQSSFIELAAMYLVSDVALVTPTRDGMNLIAKEYLASRADQTGVLILSEMAGASRELGEAIIINPNSIGEIAGSIEKALAMTPEEQVRRNEIMQARLQQYDIVRWAEEFLSTLHNVRREHQKFEARLLSGRSLAEVENAFSRASRKLLLLDYDGTLVPFADMPELARPTEELLKILVLPSYDPTVDIVLVSGRDRQQLQKWFSELDIGLVAEHGVWLKPVGSDWKLLKPLVNDWKDGIRSILRTFVDRLPGSFVEEKEYSLAWHYRRSDPELASVRAKELVENLVEFTANTDVQVLNGNKVVEVRNAGVNKGVAGLYWLSLHDYDFVLAIGDDWTDEDLFRALPDSAYTIKVGMSQSHARYNVYNHLAVIKLLSRLLKPTQIPVDNNSQ